MLLVSYGFAAFLILLIVIYYVIPEKLQWMALLAASYLFYACGGIGYLLYPLITTLTTWFLAKRIGETTRQAKEYVKEKGLDRNQKKEYNGQVKKRQRRLMQTGLLLNFGVLAVLKYTNFLLMNVNGILHAAGSQGEFTPVDWILPLGISYYTFQSMGYLIDVYQRKCEPEKNLAKFALFVSFFPQVTAGPICRFEQMKEELFSPHAFDGRKVKLGAERMLWGYFKKLVIADRLGPAVAIITGAPGIYDGTYALLGMIGYTIWLYADFSGGMDLVIGVGEILGVTLPENFDHPFSSRSLAEFWRRWHMTLMQWFREYIFFPVSTSRFSRRIADGTGQLLGKKTGNKAPVYIGSIAVWLITGIWHGASWQFITWGMANCIVMLISQELIGHYRKFHDRFAFSNKPWYQYVQNIRTSLLFSFLLMFEYYPLPVVFSMLGSMVTDFRISQLQDGRFMQLGLSGADWIVLAAGIGGMAVVSSLQKNGSIREMIEKKPWMFRYLIWFGLFMLVLLTGVYGRGYDASQFIYNQF
ncbi:MBOAT family O-acyltransferase [Lachnospiraceae bacterium 62-35]